MRSRARGASSSKTSTITSPTSYDLAGDALGAQVLAAASRRSTAAATRAWSVSTRLSSSGIARSYERMPGLDVRDRDAAPARRPARPRASSSCRRRPARRRAPRRPAAARAPPASGAVCSVLVPPPRPSRCSGGGHARARRRTPARARRRSAGRCGPAPPRATRAQRARETAAALTNWGRLPMTVRTLTRVSASSRCDALRAARSRGLARSTGPRRRRAARGRRSPRSACTSRTVEAMNASSARAQVVERARRSSRVATLEHPRAGDRGEDALLERRRQQLAVAHPEERPRRALEHAAVRRDEQRLVDARAPARGAPRACSRRRRAS